MHLHFLVERWVREILGRHQCVNYHPRFIRRQRPDYERLHIVDAPHDLRRRRVLDRNATRGDTFAFEVTPEMFDFMESRFERPTESERAVATAVQTG